MDVIRQTAGLVYAAWFQGFVMGFVTAVVIRRLVIGYRRAKRPGRRRRKRNDHLELQLQMVREHKPPGKERFAPHADGCGGRFVSSLHRLGSGFKYPGDGIYVGPGGDL